MKEKHQIVLKGDKFYVAIGSDRHGKPVVPTGTPGFGSRAEAYAWADKKVAAPAPAPAPEPEPAPEPTPDPVPVPEGTTVEPPTGEMNATGQTPEVQIAPAPETPQA